MSRHGSFVDNDNVGDATSNEVESSSPFWTSRDRTDHPDVVDLRPTMRVLLQLSSETEMHPLVLLMTKAMVDASGARRVVCVRVRVCVCALLTLCVCTGVDAATTTRRQAHRRVTC
jgi:hypothetical protein